MHTGGYSKMWKFSKFKTTLCTNYANGNCTFGIHCKYAHGEQDRRPMWSKDPKFRTKYCLNELSSVGCSYGEKCRFLHRGLQVCPQVQRPITPPPGFELVVSPQSCLAKISPRQVVKQTPLRVDKKKRFLTPSPPPAMERLVKREQSQTSIDLDQTEQSPSIELRQISAFKMWNNIE